VAESDPPGPHEIRDNRDACQFELCVGGELVVLLQYRLRPPSYALDHTETQPGFEGRGFASELVRAVLDLIRAKGGMVRPYCPYVAAYLRKHPEYLDLVTPADRERFDLPRGPDG
jgi:predicted GNAT family acetyltransferase